MPRHIILAERPAGIPTERNFRIEDRPLPVLGEGDFLVAPRVFSVDPAIRGFLDDRPSYLPPVALGAPVAGMSLGEVIESRDADYPVGCLVRALSTWSEGIVLRRDALGLEIVPATPGVALEHLMGALGPVGLTAWVGLDTIGAAKPGETVLVSAAAGATGSCAGQIAKLRGCRVIGLVGSAAKAEAILALGFDAAIDYRAAPDLSAAIRAAAPEGIDVYFDNVGGPMLDAVLPLMRLHGRVVVCGMIDQYNDADHPYGVTTLWQLVVNRVTMRGFLTYDHPEMLPRAQAELNAWVAAGKLVPLTNLHHGFEAIPNAFIDLMSGRTIGKTLVKI
ncbi:NADP-dependent oxidoreductase [Sphingomonas sp. GB1N7]|uniref:NADP-dependent oxidoreductase n=1 Tax=Parasphingomonas caseinilytica TaxID=3096158 RepID=UPI002FC86CA9